MRRWVLRMAVKVVVVVTGGTRFTKISTDAQTIHTPYHPSVFFCHNSSSAKMEEAVDTY